MSLRLPHPARVAGFRRPLLAWYRVRGRHSLPWRGTFDPYRVLVSEFMLQQTGVSTVIPYFGRFLKSFPSLRSLARAPLEKVLKTWSGLGYYARARHLHGTAQRLLKEYDGKIPESRNQVEDLPGVGPYTAGALLSFAYDRPEALVDGNVIRVLSRAFGIKGDTRRPEVLARLWAVARALVPKRGARHYNSALMDLGATVCKPGLPECSRCPLASLCWAQRNGWVDRLPASRPDKAKTRVRLDAFYIEQEGRLLLHRRPLEGLWGGLWELPMVEASSGQRATVTVDGGEVALLRRSGVFRHVLSHRDLRVDRWDARLVRPIERTRWVKREEAGKMAISSLTKKLLSS